MPRKRIDEQPFYDKAQNNRNIQIFLLSYLPKQIWMVCDEKQKKKH